MAGGGVSGGMEGTNIRSSSALPAPRKTDPEWLKPPAEEEGLVRLARILRERVLLVVIGVVVATGAAIAYVTTASEVYEAEAQLLVTPVSGNDPTLSSLGLIQSSSDPLRSVETAAVLVTNSEVANAVAEELDGDASEGRDLLKDVRAEPVAQSDLVTITAEAGEPARAQALANAFATEVVQRRTRQFRAAVSSLVESLQGRIGQSTSTVDAALASQLGTLRAMQAASTPDMRVEALAELPRSPVSPRRVLGVLGGLLAGLVLGVGVAFSRDALDPTLRREDQLRRLFRLPILTRVPRELGKPIDRPLDPGGLSLAAVEAYRTLRASLVASGDGATGGARSILVTGSSPSEGKTTTALNLAISLALAGNSVILIDADLRRPAIGKALKLNPKRGIVGVLIETNSLSESLTTTEAFGPNLEVLPAEHEGGWITDLLALPSARRMLDDAKRLADYVIIDSPPLAEVVDALPIARHVDDVLVVTRLGRSRTKRILQLGEMLAEHGVKPAGFALIGTERPEGGYLSGPGSYLDPERDKPRTRDVAGTARERTPALRRRQRAAGQRTTE